MILGFHGAHAVLRHDNEEAEIQGMPRRGQDTHFRGDPRVNDGPDAVQPKEIL